MPTNLELQHALTEKGKRHINMIWEATQACIAVVVTLTSLYAYLRGGSTAEGLANAFFLVIGFYFGRTNHSRPAFRANDGSIQR